MAADRGVQKPYGSRERPSGFPSLPSSENLELEIADGLLADLEAHTKIVKADEAERSRKMKEWLAELETTLSEYREDDTALQQMLEQFPSMMSCCRPALVGLQGAELHIPADDFGEAGLLQMGCLVSC